MVVAGPAGFGSTKYGRKIIIRNLYSEIETEQFGVPGINHIEQTLNSSYDPYSGINVNTEGLVNTRTGLEIADSDRRPSLGCFNYDEIYNLFFCNFFYFCEYSLSSSACSWESLYV